jgi:hypothetical protein
MTINFPSSPTNGQLYSYGQSTWQWTGEYWSVYSAQTGYVTSVSDTGSGNSVINSLNSNTLLLKTFSGNSNVIITDTGNQLNFTSSDNFVTGGTYSSGTLTLNRQNGSVVITGFTTSTGGGTFTGGTVTGFTTFTNGLSASTVTATNFVGNGSGLTGITVTNSASNLFNYYNFI